MAKRAKQPPRDRGFILFDIKFADGGRASNRCVPVEIMSGFDVDQAACELVEQQEAEIALKAGRPPRTIQNLTRL